MKKAIAKKAGEAFATSPESIDAELYANVRAYIANAREKVYVAANSAMVEAYWNVGREIVKKQGGAERAAYGDGLIDRLAASSPPNSALATPGSTFSICADSIWHSRMFTQCVNN